MVRRLLVRIYLETSTRVSPFVPELHIATPTLIASSSLPPPVTQPMFEWHHLSDLCGDLLGVGKVNGTAAGNDSHTGNLLCLWDDIPKQAEFINNDIYKMHACNIQ